MKERSRVLTIVLHISDSFICDSKTTTFFPQQEIRQAAEFLELPQLLMVLNNMQSREQYMNSDLNNQFKQIVRQRLENLCLEQGK